MINGSCHPEEKCKMCIDSDIVRYENESWNRNKCTKCSCKGKLYLIFQSLIQMMIFMF